MDRNRILAKNTVLLGIGQFIPKVLAIIILPILTGYLSTEEYGVYDLILSVASLALPLMTLLIQQGAFRFLIADNNKKQEIVSSAFGFLILLATIWTVVLFVIITINIYDPILLIEIFFLYIMEAIYDVAGQIIRGLRNNTKYSCGVVLYSVLNMLLLLIFLEVEIINVNTVILISSVAYLFAFIYIFFSGKLYSLFSLSSVNKNIVKKMLSYSIPIIPSSISLWIVNLSDRLIIIQYLGASSNGIYAAANKIPNLCGTVYAIFNLAWTEVAARTVDDKDRNEYYTLLYNTLFSILVGIFLLMIVASPIIFNLLINQKFSEGSMQVPILFMGVFFSSLVSFYGGVYVALQKTKQVGISSFIGALLNTVINLILVNKYGLYAASISTVLSYFLIYVYRKYDLKKMVVIKYNQKITIASYTSLCFVIALYYLNNIALFTVGSLVALIYNIYFNLPVFMKGIRKVVSIRKCDIN